MLKLFQAQVGQVTMVADLAPACKLELTSPFPSVAGFVSVSDFRLFDTWYNPECNKYISCIAFQPKSTLKFPFGEVSLEENEEQEVEEDVSPKLSVSGIFKAQLLNGICNAQYQDDNLNLRYSYKVLTYP